MHLEVVLVPPLYLWIHGLWVLLFGLQLMALKALMVEQSVVDTLHYNVQDVHTYNRHLVPICIVLYVAFHKYHILLFAVVFANC